MMRSDLLSSSSGELGSLCGHSSLFPVGSLFSLFRVYLTFFNWMNRVMILSCSSPVESGVTFIR